MSSCAAFALWVALAGGEQDWLDDFLAGSRALEEGRLDEARASFERSAQALPTHAPSAYQLACTLARGGDLEAALAGLERAIALGYDEAAVIRWDNDLSPLHVDPRFESLLAELPDRIPEVRPVFLPTWLADDSELSSTPNFAEAATRLAIWDVRSGSVLATVPRHDDRYIRATDCGSDGRFVFCSGVNLVDEPFVRVYEAATGDAALDLPEVVHLADRRSVWSRDLLAAYRHAPPRVDPVAFLAWKYSGLVLLEVSTGRVLASGLEGLAREEPIAVAPDGRAFWTASFGCLREIDANSGRALREVALDSRRILALVIRPDGSEIAAIDSAGILHVVQSKSGAVARMPIDSFRQRRESLPAFDTLRAPGWPFQIAYSPSGKHCAVWTGTEGLEVFDTQDWQLSERYGGGESRIADLAWRSDAEQLAVCTYDGRVTVFDVGREKAARVELQVTSPRTVAFEPNSTRLWIGREADFGGRWPWSGVEVRDLATGDCVRTLDQEDFAQGFPLENFTIVFLPGGETCVVSADGFARDVVVACGLRDGDRTWILEFVDRGGGMPLQVLASSDGARLVLWGWDGTHFVDTKSGAERSIDGLRPESLAFAREERVLIAANREGTQFIDAETGTTLVSRVELPESGWLLHTPSGFVDGTRAGLDAFHLSMPDRSYALDGLAAAIVDPKKVAASAAGVGVAPVRLRQPPTLVWKTPTPRTLVVERDGSPVELELEAASADGVAALEVIVDGERSLRDRLEVAASPRTFVLEFTTAKLGYTDVRVRSIDANGLASRPLHLTLDVQ